MDMDTLEYISRLLEEVRRETMQVRTLQGKIEARLEAIELKFSGLAKKGGVYRD